MELPVEHQGASCTCERLGRDPSGESTSESRNGFDRRQDFHDVLMNCDTGRRLSDFLRRIGSAVHHDGGALGFERLGV